MTKTFTICAISEGGVVGLVNVKAEKSIDACRAIRDYGYLPVRANVDNPTFEVTLR